MKAGLKQSWPKIRKFIATRLKGKQEFVISTLVFKRQFDLEGDVFKNLQELVREDGKFYVVQEYRNLKFYVLG